MRFFPVLIDARPGYLAGSPSLSLLQMPVGQATLVARLAAELGRWTPGRVTVVATFEPSPRYRAAVGGLEAAVAEVVSTAELMRRLHEFEPSDWLLIRDCVTATAEPLPLDPIFSGLESPDAAARHLVASAGTAAGTTERLLVDGDGRVVRIQRYYERVTWPFAAGVACSLVPVASMVGVRDLHVGSLSELRASLATAGVPSRDFFIHDPVFNLRREAGYLGLTERVLQPQPGRGREPSLAATAKVHQTAAVRGAVVAWDGAEVDERAVLIGPTVIGRGARVGSGAVLAQCVVAPGTEVPAGAVARQRVVTEAQAAAGALVDDTSAREFVNPMDAAHELEERNVFRRAYGFKTVLERAISAVALVLLSPLLLAIAAAIRLTSRGPVLYGDRREGRGGREFRCWKFRSMEADAHARQHELAGMNELDGPQFKLEEDPRVTPLGAWLRRLNLDELPQLLNVVRGEMSLVGPRPSPFRENQICVPWRDARLSVAPGITGLWQVCRDRSETADFHQWIYYDLIYVNHASPWLDLKILAATVLTLLGRYRVPLRWLVPGAVAEARSGQRAA